MSRSAPILVLVGLLFATGALRAQVGTDEESTATESTTKTGDEADASSAPPPVVPAAGEKATTSEPSKTDDLESAVESAAPAPDDLIETGEAQKDAAAAQPGSESAPPAAQATEKQGVGMDSPVPSTTSERSSPSVRPPSLRERDDDANRRGASSLGTNNQGGKPRGLSKGDAATVIAASAGTCAACTAGPCVLGGCGFAAAFVLSSAASPCVGIPGGTGAALSVIGGATLLSVPLLFGPGASAANLGATSLALYFADADFDLILKVLVGAIPGVLLAAISSLAFVVGALMLFAAFTIGIALPGGAAFLALAPALVVMVAATFNGGIASLMVLAGISGTVLTNLVSDELPSDTRHQRAQVTPSAPPRNLNPQTVAMRF